MLVTFVDVFFVLKATAWKSAKCKRTMCTSKISHGWYHVEKDCYPNISQNQSMIGHVWCLPAFDSYLPKSFGHSMGRLTITCKFLDTSTSLYQHTYTYSTCMYIQAYIHTNIHTDRQTNLYTKRERERHIYICIISNIKLYIICSEILKGMILSYHIFFYIKVYKVMLYKISDEITL